MKKKILKFVPIFLISIAGFPFMVFTMSASALTQASVLTEPVQNFPIQTNIPQTQGSPVQTQAMAPTDCTFNAVSKPVFEGRFLSIKMPPQVAPGQLFTMQVYVQNTGNVPWFSEKSGCNSTIVHLGTEEKRDRMSPFYTLSSNPDTGMPNTWSGPNRIMMDNARVSPDDIASFTITAQAPTQMGIYREFYSPVAEGAAWMDGEALFSVDINVGGVVLDPTTASLTTYIDQSTNLSTLDLSGGKSISVSLSQQIMYLKIGDYVVRTFPVSSGDYKDPTPPGNYKIFLKQQVRVAGSVPHYIMPLFMEFRKGGYGIHALPSLANDRGVFWQEALDHIGSPRSHGCVRLLPEDAQFAWNFVDIGTPMTVKW